MVSRPPEGIASRELTARFIRTCWIWLGSAITAPSPDADDIESSMPSPINRRSRSV